MEQTIINDIKNLEGRIETLKHNDSMYIIQELEQIDNK
jgi:hypothetical protein